MTFKRILAVGILLMGIMSSFGDDLKISVEGLNFFDSEGRTIVDVNYAVKYKNLTFKQNSDKSGAIAGLRIEVKIYNKNQILHQEAFAEQIIVSSLEDTQSNMLEHVDRYSFDYASEGNVLEMKFIDLVSKEEALFSKELPLINNRLVSDIEFNDYISDIKSDKFKYMYRGDLLYKSNPSRIFYKETEDSLYCYFQLQGLSRHSKLNWKYNYTIELRNSFDQQVDLIERSGLSTSEIANINQAINMESLPKGIYYLTVKSFDGDKNNTSRTDFSISDYPGKTYNVLAKLDDEYQIMRYFGYGATSTSWKILSSAKKRQEVNKFWMRYANSAGVTVDNIISTLKERVEYTNRKYSHHQPGWSSDRGKIYIMYGAPDDIEKFMVGELDATDKYDSDALLERRGVFNDKEYEIWRYTSQRLASYTFFDVNMNNGHKLIYVFNDDNVPVSSDYKFYLGQDFDEEKLK